MSQTMQERCDDIAGKIEEQRDALEDLADSDLPCADIAAALLEIAEGSV